MAKQIPVQFGRRGQGALALKQATNPRAPALAASTARGLKAKGFVSHQALADELNRKGIPAPRGGRWHLTTVVRLLTRLGLITLGKGRTNIRLAHKRAANARAKALASTIRKLRKAGFVSINAIARELNEREITPAQGGKWHPTTVSRLLRRLKRLEHSSARRRPTSDAERRARPSGRHRR
jgi:Recombinase